jgi:probable phosphoglycerate mutase
VTEIILIRHGETDWNAEQRVQGHIDVPLNVTGEIQAELTGRRLRAEHAKTPFGALLASDLSRAVQTAEAVRRHTGLPIREDARLRERCYGILEGTYTKDMAKKFPEINRAWRSRDPEFVIPQGESLVGFFERALDVLLDIVRDWHGQRVVVVTHGGFVDIAYRIATETPLDQPRSFKLLNASLNTIRFGGERFELSEQWADDSHLQRTQDDVTVA